MVRYISIDAGKYASKVVEFKKEKDCIKEYMFSTKVSPGDFRDDSLNKNTFLAEIDGEVLKIGNGASGDGAELTTSKATPIHKQCILFAIALFCSDSESDEVYVSVGLPADEWRDVSKREEFREYLFGTEKDKEYSIKIKTTSDGEVIEKRFVIKKSYIFPESLGALFSDDSPNPMNYLGVLDIGNLNVNASIFLNAELQPDESITSEMGGSILCQSIANALSVKFGRCSETYVMQLLKKKKRYLPATKGFPNIEEESATIITNCIYDHILKIKRMLDAKQWSDFIQIVAIGGTTNLIRKELSEVFGEKLTILKSPCYANSYAFLRLMCSRIPEINKVVPLTVEQE